MDRIAAIIILIYEYNIVAEAKRSQKSNWLDLMNNSADGPTLQERFNKANINIDRTTLKLLPILLKALNKNRYVDKIIEEPTSLYPPYERRDTTDVAYTKNIFADTRNWMKMPNSRLYAIEYKTSPIVYFKNPTRNVDYFTKIRKIRDYQRIMNYVDKMIGDKNLLGSTQPMKSDLSYTDMPIRKTKPLKNHELTEKIVNKQTTAPKTLAQEKNRNCKCPHKLGDIMQKLLTSIQHLLSYFSVPNVNKTVSSCSDTVQIRPPKISKGISSPKKHMNTNNHDILKSEVIGTTSPYKRFLNWHKYTLDFTPRNNVDMRRDYTIKTIMNLLKPNFNKHNRFDTKLESNEGFSTTNSYAGLSDTNSVTKEASTESILKYINYTDNKKPTDVITTAADYILQKEVYDESPEMNSSPSTLGDTDFTTEDDYYIDTTPNLAHDFEKLDAHSLTLVKNKMISVRNNDTIQEKSVTYPFKGIRASKNVYNNIEAMRKVGNLISSEKNNSKPLILHRFAPITKPILKPITATGSLPLISTTESTQKNLKNQTKFRYFNIKPIEDKDTIFKKNCTKSIILEKKHVKESADNISKETTLKHTEEEIKRIHNVTTTDQPEISTNSDNQWELIQLEENSTSTKSMMPQTRSTYLEMQRNDWRRDGNHDYDTNVNNDIYDELLI